MKEWYEEYRIRTQDDLTRRTKINEPETPITVRWSYPKDTMSCDSAEIVASGWCSGDSGKSFHLEIENPLESRYINSVLEPCLRWMNEHGASEDELIKWKLWDLMKHANIK